MLLLHAQRAHPYAATVGEHVRSLARLSRFPVTCVNTTYGFPAALRGLRFEGVVLHYSLFGIHPYAFDASFEEYVGQTDAFKLAFFQDEYRFHPQRLRFLDSAGVDFVYSLVQPEGLATVYPTHARRQTVAHTLPGYVGRELLRGSRRYARADADRRYDIAYRGRPVPYYLGWAGNDKTRLAAEMQRRLKSTGLAIDVSGRQHDRIYGRAWHRFLGNARGTLGLEGGASAFDLDGSLMEEHDRLLSEDPSMSYEEYSRRAEVLHEREDAVPGLTITPRHLEAAAFRCCQILLEGRYCGLLRPDEHYLELRRDFSNLDAVIERFRDPEVRRAIAEKAHADLIESGELLYERFVAELDGRLAAGGVTGSGRRRRDAVPLRLGQLAGRAGQEAAVAGARARLLARRITR